MKITNRFAGAAAGSLKKRSFKSESFTDFVRLGATAGSGGSGCSSFDRTRTKSRGRPDGGNGGDGGSVILVPDKHRKDLSFVQKALRAQDGGNGARNNRAGSDGRDCIVGVPLGTSILVFENTANDKQAPGDPILKADIDSAFDQPALVCRGGRGGRGNKDCGRNNSECERGSAGEKRILYLDLKITADFGLIGLPNAGKSSFLSCVSSAKPKIAPYPFTTLAPNIGAVAHSSGNFTIADIPGLIPGSHLDIGLGHRFLKHTLKIRNLVVLLDASRPNPVLDLEAIIQELDLFRSGLSNKCCCVVATKSDLLADGQVEKLITRLSNHPLAKQAHAISSRERRGLDALTDTLRQWIKHSRSSLYALGIAGGGLGAYYLYHLEAVPITGRYRFINIGPAQEKWLADISFSQVMEQFGGAILPTYHPIVKYTAKVVDRLVQAVDPIFKDNLEWKVYVIDAPIANAFVLPGGEIFVFTGILPIVADENGLAAVLSHEIAHRLVRHAAEKMSFYQFVTIAYGVFQFILTGDFHSPFAGIVKNVLIMLPFSRKCEMEADYIGLLVMARACYEPTESINLWKRMEALNAASQVHQFMSTHPSHKSRIRNLNGVLGEARTVFENSGCEQLKAMSSSAHNNVYSNVDSE